MAKTSRQFKIQADDDTIKRLHDLAGQLGDSITPNGISAMFTYEASRLPAHLIWQALGHLRQMAEEAESQGAKKQIASPRPQLARAS